MYKPNSPWTWSFLTTAFLQAAIVLAMECYVFAKFQLSLRPQAAENADTKPVPVDLSLFIFGFVYQCVLVYDSLRLKNTIQVIGLCIYNLGMLVYSAIQVDQIKEAITTLQTSGEIPGDNTVWTDVQPVLIAVPCVIALGTIILSFIAWKLYDEFAWSIYKHISADLRMRRRFLTFQIYITLLKFDFFFFVGFTVQFLVVVTNVTDVEFALTAAAVPVTILILLMAAFWTRREAMAGMMVVMVLYFGGLAYFCFKLVRMYQPSHERDYEPARKTMTVFAVLTIVLIILTIANTVACMLNFNKGLQPLIMKRKIGNDEEKIVQMNDLPEPNYHRPAPARMTID